MYKGNLQFFFGVALACILFAVSAENIFKVPPVYSFMNGRFLPDKPTGCRLSAQEIFQSPPLSVLHLP